MPDSNVMYITFFRVLPLRTETKLEEIFLLDTPNITFRRTPLNSF